MKKQSLAVIFTIAFLWGCGSGEQAQVTNTNPNTDPTQSPTQDNQADGQPEEQTPESDILASSSPSGPPSGLIPTTDPLQRLRQVNQGTNDPFSVLPPPQAIINVQSPVVADNGDVTEENGANSQGTTNALASVNGINGVDSVGNINACGSSLGQDGNSSQPSIPNPRDAQAVLVSGVMQIDGESVAIVKTPEYDYSYPIRQGNYIANGLVLVKNIDPSGEEPVVVLEQYGQEVVRRVGEKPVPMNGNDSAMGDFKLPFNREQLNIINNEVDGLVLTSIEDIVPVKFGGDATQPNQTPQEVIEISGFICNISNQPLTVTDIYLGLNTENTTLPPLNAYFQGIQQGDVNTRQTQVTKQARIIPPNKKTLFRGTVANSRVFNTTEKIDVILSDWN